MKLRAAVELSDLERLRDAEAPDFLSSAWSLLGQPAPELPPPSPEGERALTLSDLRDALRRARYARGRRQRSELSQKAWGRYLAQAPELLDPRLGLADLLESLYDRASGFARETLFTAAREAPLVLGVWGALKRVYKRAEADYDAALFGVLAARFDLAASTESQHADVSRGTLVYLRRRAARFLRQLGKAAPELYPQFAVEVLRSYPAGSHLWAAQLAVSIMAGTSKKWGAPTGLPRTHKFRAPYLETWRQSPDALMLLLSECEADFVAAFAISGLKELFPDLRASITPAWLSRLAARASGPKHDFLIELLEGSPELHPARLKEIGLHEPVLGLLTSPSPKARAYAIDYARAFADELTSERLVALLERPQAHRDTSQFALAVLSARPAQKLGVRVLGRLLAHPQARPWAERTLETDFDRSELPPLFLRDLLLAGPGPSEWARRYVAEKRGELDASFWTALLDDARFAEAPHGLAAYVFARLERTTPSVLSGDWLLGALARPELGEHVARWLARADALPPLDLERLRALAFDRALRPLILPLLAHPKLLAQRGAGLPFLLSLARSGDPELHGWAERQLLSNMAPEHFAEGPLDGVERLFVLALGPKQPDPMRAFAQTYLRCHHPVLGPAQPEARALALTPRIARDAYTRERLWPALSDLRPDVRRFAAAITRVELRRWDAQARVYELAESSAREVRAIAQDALLMAGEPDADPELALTLDELSAARIFALTESPRRPTRALAIQLIRKHYDRLGGLAHLAWLMQSADREVRELSIALLWEHHHPRRAEGAQAVADREALRMLLRTTLFSLPPGRGLEPLDRLRVRKVPASVTKRHLVELVRDLGLRDAAFAAEIAPVLAELSGSLARGEWQACLSALLTLRRAHGSAVVEALS